jgi:hypothetical protein
MTEQEELEVMEEYLLELEANMDRLEDKANMATYLAMLSGVLEGYSE